MPLDPSNWSDSVAFSHDPAQVGSDLAHAKLVLRLDSRDLSAAQASGADVRVTDDGDNVLDYEIEEFDRAADLLVVWFRVPSLSSSTPQEFRVYWGNPGAADAQNAAGLWGTGPEDYQEVFHYPTGSPLSGSLAHDLEVRDGAPGTRVGVLGQAGDYDGNDSHRSGPENSVASSFNPGNADGVGNPSDFTIEGWIRCDTFPDVRATLFSRHYNHSLDAWEQYVNVQAVNDGRIYYEVGTTEVEGTVQRANVASNEGLNDGAWHHIVARFRTGSGMDVWVDGVQVAADNTITQPSPDYGDVDTPGALDGPLHGIWWFPNIGVGNEHWLDGGLDEIRYCYASLSDDRIGASYAVQSQPGLDAGFWNTGALNQPPDKPTLIVAEARETGASLESSPFSDPDGDAHDASRWQVIKVGGSFADPFYDSGWTALDLESHEVADGTLPSGLTWEARVAHRDPAGEFTWSDPVTFSTGELPELSSVEGLFFGQSGGDNLWEFGGHHLDLSDPITGRIQTAPIAPGGMGGEAAFHNLYLELKWQSQAQVVVTPIVDGNRRSDLSRTIDLAQQLEPTRDRFEVPLLDPYDPGTGEALRRALRGTWFQAEVQVVPDRPSEHGVMVEGVELEHEVVRESHPGVSYAVESLVDVDHERAVPWYMGAAGDLLEGDRGLTDDGAAVTVRVQTAEVAPAGPGGEAAFHNAYLAVTRSNGVDATLTLTPLVDGAAQTARDLVLSAVAGPVTEVLEVPLTEPYDPGTGEALRYAPRGAFFALRLETEVPDGAIILEGIELEQELVRESEAPVG